MKATTIFSLPLDVIEFCAQECAFQQSGELSVFHMCNAWADVHCHAKTGSAISLEDVIEWGRLVEPEKNRNGLRTTPIHFSDMSVALHADMVPSALTSLLWGWDSLSAEEIFQEFQEIHPFLDGNGRVGALLFNLKKEMLLTPQHSPMFQKR